MSLLFSIASTSTFFAHPAGLSREFAAVVRRLFCNARVQIRSMSLVHVAARDLFETFEMKSAALGSNLDDPLSKLRKSKVLAVPATRQDQTFNSIQGGIRNARALAAAVAAARVDRGEESLGLTRPAQPPRQRQPLRIWHQHRLLIHIPRPSLLRRWRSAPPTMTPTFPRFVVLNN